MTRIAVRPARGWMSEVGQVDAEPAYRACRAASRTRAHSAHPCTFRRSSAVGRSSEEHHSPRQAHLRSHLMRTPTPADVPAQHIGAGGTPDPRRTYALRDRGGPGRARAGGEVITRKP
jgi:hypothetical protein